MSSPISSARRLTAALAALFVASTLAAPAAAQASSRSSRARLSTAIEPTGGAGLGGPAPSAPRRPRVLHAPSKKAHGVWMHTVTITEYWPAPEAWFVGRLVTPLA